jgi:hypothetical protein
LAALKLHVNKPLGVATGDIDATHPVSPASLRAGRDSRSAAGGAAGPLAKCVEVTAVTCGFFDEVKRNRAQGDGLTRIGCQGARREVS